MFYSASESRKAAMDRRAVFDEVALIERHIMDAVDDGALGVVVGPGSDTPVATGMSVSADHYNAYTNPSVYVAENYTKARAQMHDVLKHFETKGYIVRVARHLETSTFNWVCKW